MFCRLWTMRKDRLRSCICWQEILPQRVFDAVIEQDLWDFSQSATLSWGYNGLNSSLLKEVNVTDPEKVQTMAIMLWLPQFGKKYGPCVKQSLKLTFGYSSLHLIFWKFYNLRISSKTLQSWIKTKVCLKKKLWPELISSGDWGYVYSFTEINWYMKEK